MALAMAVLVGTGAAVLGSWLPPLLLLAVLSVSDHISYSSRCAVCSWPSAACVQPCLRQSAAFCRDTS